MPSPASKPMLNSNLATIRKPKPSGKKLADKGNTTALINLANLLQQGMEYEKGVLLHRLIEIFASLLQQLLQQDNVDGQTTENVFLPQHQRVAAFKWLRKARENQHRMRRLYSFIGGFGQAECTSCKISLIFSPKRP
jgi:hypothetical protein